METQKLPPFLPFIFTAAILFVIGAGGLFWLVTTTLPFLGPRWLFFFLLTLAVCGIALPVIYFFHWRFPAKVGTNASVIIRQAIWVGIYFDIITWLQLGRVLSFTLVVFLAVGLIVIEFGLRLSEKSRFTPKEIEHE